MEQIKDIINELGAAAERAGLPAVTEKQADFIVVLMGRKNISAALFKGQTMLTKRGASNYINDLKVMQVGVI